MKKVLLFHLYVNDIISDNKNYSIHKECLKYYKNVFDELIFYICVSDINNHEIINDAISWVNEICIGSKYDIKIRQNTCFCETETFKSEVIDNRERYKDSLVFITHTKNVTRLHKDLSLNAYPDENGYDTIPESIIKWCIGMYFYNLNFPNEVEQKLIGCPLPAEIFYGTFLTCFNKTTHSKFNMVKSNCFYVGTSYWINMNKFNNYIDEGKIKLPSIDDRYWFEALPGVICDIKNYGDGLSTHDRVYITDDFDLYKMNDEEWKYLIYILGDQDEFWNLYNNVINSI